MYKKTVEKSTHLLPAKSTHFSDADQLLHRVEESHGDYPK